MTMAPTDIIAARRSRGLAYSDAWKASGFATDLIDSVQHGQYVVHVPTSNSGRVTPGTILKQLVPGTAAVPCYTLLLGSANPLALYTADAGHKASKTWSTYMVDRNLPGGRTAKCIDIRTGVALKIMVSNLSVCNHIMYCVSSDVTNLTPQTHVVGCSCPDWFHRHVELTGAYRVYNQTGDNYRGCKHMWALRILLEPLADS